MKNLLVMFFVLFSTIVFSQDNFRDAIIESDQYWESYAR
jgi:hypothetical protein